MFALLAIVGTFLYGTLLGWLVHWGVHNRWSGFAHKAHMTHHIKLYPPGDLLSDTYRQSGKDNTTLVFTPIITVGFLIFGGVLRLLGASWVLLGGLVFEGIVIGWAHDQMHTLFHLTGTMLNRFKWFQHLQNLHFYHHRNMKRNLGIFFFGWDRVFKTFRNVR